MRSKLKVLVAVFLMAAMIFTLLPASAAIAGPKGRGNRKPGQTVEETQAPETETVVETEAEETETVVETEAVVETETVEETEAVVETEAAMPEQSFEDTADDVTVSVEAEEGAFPEGTTMAVQKVNVADIEQAVSDTVDGPVQVVLAVDITFKNAAGEEIQPEKEIKVSLTPAYALNEDTNYSVVHVKEDVDTEELVCDVLEDEKIERIDADGAEFNADSFSVYALIGEGEAGDNARATVNFWNGDTKIETFYVKDSDVLLGTEERDPNKSYIEDIVFDPGVGELESNEIFRGWTFEENYDQDTEAKDIDDIRSYLESLEIKEGDVVNIYAMIFKIITVSYLGEKNVALGSTTIVLTGEISTSYTVNMSYTPSSSYQNFEGWSVSSGSSNIEGYTAGTIYKNGTDITISGDVTFSVEAPVGHWLVFDEVEKGATYNAPQFVKQGEKTTEPSLDMQLVGYTFGGWYTDKNYTTEFAFGQELTDNTTVYAKWIPKGTADYTVIIWKQNVNDAKNAADSAKTYDFAESTTLNGTVGQTINTVTATGTGNGRYASVNGTAKRYTGFHLNKYDTNVTIDTKGNTIVNVYYDRNLVTLTFQYRQNSRWQTQATMTGLYGSTLTSNGYTWPTNRWWYDDYESGRTGYSGAGTRTTFLDAFILSDGGSDQTFYGFTGNGNRTVHFLKKNASGNGYTETNTVTTSNGTFNISDKYNGYKAVSYSTNNSTWTNLGDKDAQGYYASVSNYTNLYIRFDPLRYNILYMDGVYVDGDGNPVEGYANRGELNEVKDIPFESNLASYNNGGSDYYAPTFTGFVFGGWYIDDKCTHEYTFTNMPEGITVYAKWVLVQYRVFLHPNAGTDSTLDWGSESQEMNFRVSLGGKVSAPTGLRKEYEMVGWYLDEDCTQVFNADAYVLNDTTVTTPYDKTTDMTDPMDKWGNIGSNPSNADVDRFWITKKLDLYAKWRAILVGADGIGVVYDAAGGSNAPSDILLYKDSSGAIAQAASTAPAGKQFLYWVVQTWDEEKGDYVDTDINVYPGDTFTVLKSDAKVVENPESTEENPSFTYTVQLRAEYGNNDVAKNTYINWYRNWDSSDTVETGLIHADKGLQINEAVTIYTLDSGIPTRPGYKFLGWAREKEYEQEESGKPAGDAITYHEVTEENLYLKWDADANKYQAQNDKGTWVDVTKVAADEKMPYHALYAVWKAEYFYIYHSSDNTVEKVGFDQLTDGKYDITSKVKGDYIYGGYYTDYVKKGEYDLANPAEFTSAVPGSKAYVGGLGYWKKAAAFTDKLIDGEGGIGTAMVPVANHTYFLKEVPAGFLESRLYIIYDAHDDNTVVHNYLISVVDDNNYEDISLYANNIETGNRIKLATSYTINDTFNNKSDKYTAKNPFNMKAGYVAVWKPDLAEKDFEFAAAYTTPDGINVEGASMRKVSIGDGKYKGNFTPGNNGFSVEKIDNDRIKKPGQLVK